MRIPLPRGFNKGMSVNVNAQTLINWYTRIDQKEGKAIRYVVNTPGLTEVGQPVSGVEVRGMIVVGSVLYAVCGDSLYSITTGWVATDVGELNTDSGYVCMTEDGSYVAISDGTYGYTYNIGTDTFADITDADYVGGGSMTFQDGYFTSSEPSDQTVQISTVNNPTEYDATEVKDASVDSDNVVRVISYKSLLWVFGERSTEFWYNTPNVDFPYVRVPGGFMDMGILSVGSVATTELDLFWLSNKRQLCKAVGTQAEIVSPEQYDYILSQLSTVSDCTMYAYNEGGDSIVVMNFPTENVTYCYHTTTGEVHRWESYKTIQGSTSYVNRHRSNCYAYFNGYHVVGDYSNGKIYTLSRTVYADDGEYVLREAVFPHIYDPEGGNLLRLDSFKVEFEAGVGLTAGAQGEDPQIMIQYSTDGGHTWSAELWRTLGKIGEYNQDPPEIQRCGIEKDFVFKLKLSDPVKPIMIAAYAEAQRMKI